MSEKKKPSAKKSAAKKGVFKQPLQKPAPWSFGGRTAQAHGTGGAKAQPDAERRAGKSRKVH